MAVQRWGKHGKNEASTGLRLGGLGLFFVNSALLADRCHFLGYEAAHQ